LNKGKPTDDPPRRRSLADHILWWLGSLVVLQQTGGLFWFWGRQGRERRFIHRMLQAYPGLAERPPSELTKVAQRVLASLGIWKITLASVAVTMVTLLLATPVFIAIRQFGVSLPQWSKVVLAVFAAGIASDQVRRWFISRALDRGVADVYPTLFCSCGYCLMGLPLGSLCPECGGHHTRNTTADE